MSDFEGLKGKRLVEIGGEVLEDGIDEPRYRGIVYFTQGLSLQDAERETELAALIEAQDDEERRGAYTDSEAGHFADKSIDAPLTADGFTILDTLGDEDENLEALMEEV